MNDEAQEFLVGCDELVTELRYGIETVPANGERPALRICGGVLERAALALEEAKKLLKGERNGP